MYLTMCFFLSKLGALLLGVLYVHIHCSRHPLNSVFSGSRWRECLDGHHTDLSKLVWKVYGASEASKCTIISMSVSATVHWKILSLTFLQTYPRDDWRLKAIVRDSHDLYWSYLMSATRMKVVFVWTIDTIHQGLITNTIYTYLVTEYGNPAFLETIVEYVSLEDAINCP